MDENYMLVEDIFCQLCYEMYYTEHCLHTCTDPRTVKLLGFIEYLRCQKEVIDKSNEDYMPLGDYVPVDCDENVILMGNYPPLLNERVIAKYYNKLVKLEERDICIGDWSCCNKFKRWKHNQFEGVEKKNFSLPVDLECGSISQSKEISTIVEEPKLNDNYNLIRKEPNENVEINEDKSNAHSSEFIDCIEIDFVINFDEEAEVYIVEFELDGIEKSYYTEKENVEVWKNNEKWSKIKRRKMDNASKSFFRCT